MKKTILFTAILLLLIVNLSYSLSNNSKATPVDYKDRIIKNICTKKLSFIEDKFLNKTRGTSILESKPLPFDKFENNSSCLDLVSDSSSIELKNSQKIIEKYNDKNGNRISDELERKLDGKKDFIDLIVALDHPPNLSDFQLIRRYNGIVFDSWSNLIYVVHAKIPRKNLIDFSSNKGIVIIEDNAEIHSYLDISVGQISVRPEVWTTYGYQGNSSQAVALLDTGIDDSHLDLSGKIVKWKDFTDHNYIDPEDKAEHGTHCASIISGNGSSSGMNNKKYTWSGYFTNKNSGEFIATKTSQSDIGSLSLHLEWDDDFEDGEGEAMLWIDKNRNGSIESNEWIHGGSPLTYSYHLSPGDTWIGVGAYDSLSYLEDFYCQITSAEPSDDGFYLQTGVAPSCKLAGLKVLNDTGSGTLADILNALDWLAANAPNYNIICASLSFGSNSIIPSLDTAVNNLVSTGVSCVVAAGNDQGVSYIGSPGSASKAITVGAVNDNDALTEYSSLGDPSIIAIKPDVLASGGSYRVGDGIIAADSNDADNTYKIDEDRYPDDYRSMRGTSMACPHVSGLIALLGDAFSGWSYSENQALKAKQIILMTSYEVGSAENNSYTPPFNHGLKDNKEGYGRVCGDAAIEAATMYFSPVNNTFSFGDEVYDKKVWARKINLTDGKTYNFLLDVPSTGNFDLYLYDSDPDPNGEPVLLSSSYNTGSNQENIEFTSKNSGTFYLVSKWRSGYGEALLSIPSEINCNFSWTPTYPLTNDTVVFTDRSNDSDIVSWNWSFDDGNYSTKQNPNHSFSDDGIYNVSLNVTDMYGATNKTFRPVTVFNVGPTAEFTFQPENPSYLQTISFIDNSTDSDGYIVSWNWSFDDGNTSNEISPEYTYANAGTYNVSLTVKDDDNANHTICKQINISSIPPHSNFTFSPVYPDCNKTVCFNGTGTDADGFIVNWSWNFGGLENKYGQNVSYRFLSFRSYNVTLTVEDDSGFNSSTTKKIILKKQSSTVVDGEEKINLTKDFNIILSLNATNSTIVNISQYSENPTGENLSSAITALGKYLEIVLGNESRISYPINITFFYNQTDLDKAGLRESQLLGIYYWNESTEEWQIYNDTGVNTSYEKNGNQGFLWANIWHLTNITFGGDTIPPEKVTGLEVKDAKDGKLDVSWNKVSDNVAVYFYKIYRDGKVIDTVSYTEYLDIGLTNDVSYTYQVSAVDSCGNEGEQSIEKTGSPTETRPPSPPTPPTPPSGGGGSYSPPANRDPVADAGGPYFGTPGEEIEFDGTKSNDSDGEIVSYSWNFGDENTASGMITNHTYLTAGEYTVTLTVEDDDDATDTDTKTVLIAEANNPPEDPTITGPSEGKVNVSYNFTFVSADNDNDTLQYIIDWGNGTNTTTEFLSNGTSIKKTHNWTTAGTYTITVRSYDNDTHSGNVTHTVVIKEQTEDETSPVEPKEKGRDIPGFEIAVLLISLIFILFWKKH